MSPSTIMEAHIAYELIDDPRSDVVAIEFLTEEIVLPLDARDLGEQLHSLVNPDYRQQFVLDFGNVRSLGSTAFGEIVAFARRVGRLYICNMQESLRFGSDLTGLNDCAEFAASREIAINRASRAALLGEKTTAGYRASWSWI